MTTFDGVLLDLYDTLAASQLPSHAERLSTRLGVEPLDLLKAFQVTRPHRGTGQGGSAEGDTRAILEALDLAPSDELVREITGHQIAHLRDGGLQLYPDALPVIRELRADGVRVGLLSNCDHWTRPAVDALGLDEEMDAVVLSFEVGAIKPDPEIYLTALESLGVDAPDRVLFVDDQVPYLDGAAAVGMRTAQIVRELEVSDHTGRLRRERPTGPHPIITSLAELLG